MSDWELKSAAKAVAEYMCNIRKGENVVIYADTASDEEVTQSIAEAAYLTGGTVSSLLYETRPKADMEPPTPISVAMKEADVLIELAEKYLIHTNALREALDSGARFACLTGLTPSMMKKCIGNVEYYAKVLNLGETISDILKKTKELGITTPKGTEFSCNIEGKPIDHASKRIYESGEQSYLGGQVSWYPVSDSLNGTMVFDGSIWPPSLIGLINDLIELKIVQGKVTQIEGGNEARLLKSWFKSFDNQNIYNLAHISYGLNPGAKLGGNILEDERVFGSIEVGIGAQPPGLGIFDVDPAEETNGHTDVIMLNPTVQADGEIIEEEGVFTHPEIVKITEDF